MVLWVIKENVWSPRDSTAGNIPTQQLHLTLIILITLFNYADARLERGNVRGEVFEMNLRMMFSKR